MGFDVWHLSSDLRPLRSNLGHRNPILALNALWEGETTTSTPIDQVRSKHLDGSSIVQSVTRAAMA